MKTPSMESFFKLSFKPGIQTQTKNRIASQVPFSKLHEISLNY